MSTNSAPANGIPVTVMLGVAAAYLLGFVLIIVIGFACCWSIDNFPCTSAVVLVGGWIIWLIRNPKEALIFLGRAALDALRED